jgi:DNA-directed RNA polymerase subunit M/transcription elongation factor TFIIS
MDTIEEVLNKLGPIKWKDGTDVVTFDDIPLLYDIVTMVVKYEPGIEKASKIINDWTSKYNRNEISLFDFETNCDLLNSFTKVRSEYYEELKRTRNSLDVVEGIIQCPHCKSWKTTLNEIQIRSADEPTDKICNCLACGYKWREH